MCICISEKGSLVKRRKKLKGKESVLFLGTLLTEISNGNGGMCDRRRGVGVKRRKGRRMHVPFRMCLADAHI